MSNKVSLVNATPHAITVGEEVFAPSGLVARVTFTVEDRGEINGFPLVANQVNEVEGLPLPEEGKVFIVSAMVLSHSTRGDLIAPDTNRATRDDKGNIVSVPGFVCR